MARQNWIRNKVEWERRSTLSKVCSPVTVPVLLFMHLTMTPEQEPSRCVRKTRQIRPLQATLER